MINPTELRKGNLVDYERTNHIITELHSDKCLHLWGYAGPDGDGYYTPYELINPIPLTPELLEQLGFEKSGSNYENDDIELMEWIDGFILLNGEARSHWNLTYKHLHELQNVYYWLTKKELQFTPSAPQSPNT